MSPVAEIIRTHIAEQILFTKNGYPYEDDASFLREGIVDSLNIMELVMFVEEKFGIAVADNEIVPKNFDSVSNLTAYVCHKTPSLATVH